MAMEYTYPSRKRYRIYDRYPHGEPENLQRPPPDATPHPSSLLYIASLTTAFIITAATTYYIKKRFNLQTAPFLTSLPQKSKFLARRIRVCYLSVLEFLWVHLSDYFSQNRPSPKPTDVDVSPPHEGERGRQYNSENSRAYENRSCSRSPSRNRLRSRSSSRARDNNQVSFVKEQLEVCGDCAETIKATSQCRSKSKSPPKSSPNRSSFSHSSHGLGDGRCGPKTPQRIQDKSCLFEPVCLPKQLPWEEDCQEESPINSLKSEFMTEGLRPPDNSVSSCTCTACDSVGASSVMTSSVVRRSADSPLTELCKKYLQLAQSDSHKSLASESEDLTSLTEKCKKYIELFPIERMMEDNHNIQSSTPAKGTAIEASTSAKVKVQGRLGSAPASELLATVHQTRQSTAVRDLQFDKNNTEHAPSCGPFTQQSSIQGPVETTDNGESLFPGLLPKSKQYEEGICREPKILRASKQPLNEKMSFFNHNGPNTPQRIQDKNWIFEPVCLPKQLPWEEDCQQESPNHNEPTLPQRIQDNNCLFEPVCLPKQLPWEEDCQQESQNKQDVSQPELLTWQEESQCEPLSCQNQFRPESLASAKVKNPDKLLISPKPPCCEGSSLNKLVCKTEPQQRQEARQPEPPILPTMLPKESQISPKRQQHYKRNFPRDPKVKDRVISENEASCRIVKHNPKSRASTVNSDNIKEGRVGKRSYSVPNTQEQTPVKWRQIFLDSSENHSKRDSSEKEHNRSKQLQEYVEWKSQLHKTYSSEKPDRRCFKSHHRPRSSRRKGGEAFSQNAKREVYPLKDRQGGNKKRVSVSSHSSLRMKSSAAAQENIKPNKGTPDDNMVISSILFEDNSSRDLSYDNFTEKPKPRPRTSLGTLQPKLYK